MGYSVSLGQNLTAGRLFVVRKHLSPVNQTATMYQLTSVPSIEAD